MAGPNEGVQLEAAETLQALMKHSCAQVIPNSAILVMHSCAQVMQTPQALEILQTLMLHEHVHEHVRKHVVKP